MIDSAFAPKVVDSAMLALRNAILQERNVAAIVLQQEAKKPAFEGNGPSNPNLGKVLDITA